MKGLNLKSPKNLKIIPYGLTQSINDKNAINKTTSSAAVGGDIKYSLTPGLTLDVTYNTDFAQVEVDEQQVNLDRFNLFFPEKRPFFLENAGQFSVGSAGEIDLFFTHAFANIFPNQKPTYFYSILAHISIISYRVNFQEL